MHIGPIIRSTIRNPVAAILIALQIALTLAIVSNAIYIISERIGHMARSTGVVESELLYSSLHYFGKEVNKEHQAQLDIKRLLENPSVKSVSYTNSVPLGGSNRSTDVCHTSPDGNDGECPYGASLYFGDESLLQTFGLDLVAGRNFLPEEVGAALHKPNPRAKVIIISQAIADAYFPGGDALGKTLNLRSESETIVGIVARLQRPGGRSEADHAAHTVIFPLRQTSSYLVVRVEIDALADIQASLAQDLIALNDRRVVRRVRSAVELRDSAYRNDRAMIYLLTTVIALLVLITALGIAGLISFNVASRHKQIGTRRALGASRADILQYFMLENGMISLIGLGLGAVLALMLNQFLIRSYELSSIDPIFLVGSLVGVFIISQIATLLPAMRGARISPAIATRTV